MGRPLFSRGVLAGVLCVAAASFILPSPAQAQTVVVPAAPIYAYVPERAGLFGQRIVYRPVLQYAVPAGTAVPVASYAPTTTLYAPGTIVARPIYAVPAPILAPAAPVTTYYAPAPLTAGWFSPPATSAILAPPATALPATTLPATPPAASLAPSLSAGGYVTAPGQVTTYYAPLRGTIAAPAPIVGTAQAPAPLALPPAPSLMESESTPTYFPPVN